MLVIFPGCTANLSWKLVESIGWKLLLLSPEHYAIKCVKYYNITYNPLDYTYVQIYIEPKISIHENWIVSLQNRYNIAVLRKGRQD